jgi:DNA (cytosine-5)-methyltransferase 1
MSKNETISLFELMYKPIEKFEGILKIGTFFSGIGSPEKALKRLTDENIISGYEVMFFCEINSKAARSYCAIHNEDINKNKVDINKIKGRDLPYCDLWVGGFPCQDISNAGNRKGFDFDSTTRSSLGWEMIRLIKEVKDKPKFIIFENVASIMNKNFIKTLHLFMNDIEKLGYTYYAKILNSKDYGIPQSRKRFFLVCILGEYYYKFPSPFKLDKKLKDVLEKDVSKKYYLSEVVVNENDKKAILNNKKNPKHKFVIDKFKYIKGEVCGYDTSTKYNQCRRLFSENGVINTLTASSIVDGSKIVVSEDGILRVRSLTPKESFILMGFDEEDYKKASKVNNKTNLYHQAGNSIVVDVMYCMLKNILK